MESEEVRIVRLFNEAINRHDVDGISALMAEDHTFTDSGGTVTTGVESMKDGWEGFFSMFPDYRNEISGYLQDGITIMAYGSASCTYNGNRGLVPENRITMPAAWRAVVRDGRVVEWQVFVDWSEGGKIIEDDDRAARSGRE